MDTGELLRSTKRVGTGLSFVVLPLVFVFAFSAHPGLLHPRFLDPSELVARALGAPMLHLGHALVTLDTALLVVVALHFMKVLERRAAWAGFAGGSLAVLGALALAADKGALCLTVSALDGLSRDELAAMTPGLLAMFSKHGWMVLVWGIVLLPIGYGIQAAALIRSGALPRWQGVLFLIGVLFIATPDGVEIVNLGASILLACSFVPYGVRMLRGAGRGDPVTGLPTRAPTATIHA